MTSGVCVLAVLAAAGCSGGRDCRSTSAGPLPEGHLRAALDSDVQSTAAEHDNYAPGKRVVSALLDQGVALLEIANISDVQDAKERFIEGMKNVSWAMKQVEADVESVAKPLPKPAQPPPGVVAKLDRAIALVDSPAEAEDSGDAGLQLPKQRASHLEMEAEANSDGRPADAELNRPDHHGRRHSRPERRHPRDVEDDTEREGTPRHRREESYDDEPRHRERAPHRRYVDADREDAGDDDVEDEGRERHRRHRHRREESDERDYDDRVEYDDGGDDDDDGDGDGGGEYPEPRREHRKRRHRHGGELEHAVGEHRDAPPYPRSRRRLEHRSRFEDDASGRVSVGRGRGVRTGVAFGDLRGRGKHLAAQQVPVRPAEGFHRGRSSYSLGTDRFKRRRSPDETDMAYKAADDY